MGTISRRAALTLALMWVLPETGRAGDLPGLEAWADLSAQSRQGRLTLAYQRISSDGLLDGSGNRLPGAATDSHSLALGIDYPVGRRWTLHASIPFIRKRSRNDPGAHDPTVLEPPQPQSRFLDDGRYHGAWQDWQFGASHQSSWAGFDIRSHAILTWPSHDYTFFASAAVGQRLRKLRVGADASRRLGQSNLHYSFGYSYEWVEEVLGVHLDKHHYRAATRYDFSPAWSGQLFLSGRRGSGLQPSDFFGRPRTTETWYQHDRMLRHNYRFAGVGGAWRINDDWTVGASFAWFLGGDSMHRIRDAWDVQVSRAF